MKYRSIIRIVMFLSFLLGCANEDNIITPKPQTELKNVIVYVSKTGSGKRQIYIMNSDGTNQKKISNNSYNNDNPVLSPDCNTIYYDKYVDNFSYIYSMNSDGTNQKTISKDVKIEEIHPYPSPDGKRLVAASLDLTYGYYFSVFTMNIDGTDRKRVESSSACWCPSWSPTGSKIVFISEPNWPKDVFVIDTNGLNKIWLTHNPTTDKNDYDPIFSSDGKKIAFTATREGNSEIYIINEDGTSPINLSNNSSEDKHPSFSPDGKFIAFSSNRDGHYQIYVMDIDGKNQKNISNNQNEETMPNWSAK